MLMKDQRKQNRALHAPAEHAPSLRDVVLVALALAGAAVAVAQYDRPACGLKRVPVSAALGWRRPPPKPVILTPFHANSDLRIRTARAALLRDFGDARVHLTSSNSFSEGAIEASLAEYLATTSTAHERANESYYLFGPMVDERLAALVASYEFPRCGGAWCAPSNLAASFGVAGLDSGVSYHTHGSGFGEVLHGRKRWLLYAPSASPPPGHDPDTSTAAWVRDVLPTLSRRRRPRHDCILGPGELLYFPPNWWHATRNEDAHAVFVSSFASDHARDEGGFFANAAPRPG